MKVKDLIKALQQHDSEMLVVVDGYEGGYDSVSAVKVTKIVIGDNLSEWCGEHCEPYPGEKGVNVVYLPRKS